MWILSCTGDILNGKRSWLRPGSIHLLGRTSGRGDGEQIRFIDHKSVSRKHLIIKVGEATDHDRTSIHSRTKIELIDGSKIGTSINGEKIKQETKVLTEKSCTIKLGSYEQEFHLEWQPVVITNTGLSKASRQKEELNKLGETDVKLIQAYVIGETTHLIAKKRNTPTVLQALLQGKWVVKEGWVDALVQSTLQQSSRAPDEPARSPLEEDWDAYWPKEANFLVPASTEPVPREDHFLLPNPERAEIFRDFTFVFLSQSQHESLLPVVTGGGGKAVLWDVEIGVSKVPDLVSHVHSIAGKGNKHDFKLSQYDGPGGVVVVRLNDKEDQRVRDFLRDVDLTLEQRSIEQSEFLDAVLKVDAADLRRPLLEEMDEDGSSQVQTPVVREPERDTVVPEVVMSEQTESVPAREASVAIDSQAPQAESSSQPLTKRRTRRIITQSRFKGFDDIDASDFKRPASPSPDLLESVPEVENSAHDKENNRQSVTTRSQKRPRTLSSSEDIEDQKMSYDSLLQGQAALKKRRLETNTMANITEEDDDTPTPELNTTRTRRRKLAKDIDVAAQLEAHRIKEAEEHRIKDEALRQQMHDTDVLELKNLAIVEEMPVPERTTRSFSRSQPETRDSRWDPRWDGRKNFKKFRRQGQITETQPRRSRVIVALEEVPRRGHGLGDEYWLTSNIVSTISTSEATSQSQARSTAQNSSLALDENYDNAADGLDSTTFHRRVRQSRLIDDESAQDQQLYPEEIAGRPRDATIDSTMRSTAATGTTLAADDTQIRGARKRPATSQGGAAAKRSRSTKITSQATPVVVDDDSDDDALKFRRRRR